MRRNSAHHFACEILQSGVANVAPADESHHSPVFVDEQSPCHVPGALIRVNMPSEVGGPFVVTTGGEEFAEGTDESNPEDAEAEPFPKT